MFEWIPIPLGAVVGEGGMNMKVDGRIAIVTGASSGISRSLVVEPARRGTVYVPPRCLLRNCRTVLAMSLSV